MMLDSTTKMGIYSAAIGSGPEESVWEGRSGGSARRQVGVLRRLDLPPPIVSSQVSWRRRYFLAVAQGPVEATLTPAASAKQALKYVSPSQPHTSPMITEHVA